MLYRINAFFDDVNAAEAAAAIIRGQTGVNNVFVLPEDNPIYPRLPGAFLTGSAYPPSFVQYSQYQNFYHYGMPFDFYSPGNESDMLRSCMLEIYTEGDPSEISSAITNLHGLHTRTEVLSA